MMYSYLLFNVVVLTLSIVGVALYRKATFPKLKVAALSIGIVMIPFVIGDHRVESYWWWFNPTRIIGLRIGNLPIEEILFFVCIPWSCLVIWVNLKDRIKGTLSAPLEQIMLVFLFPLVFVTFKNTLWYSLFVVLGLVSITLVSLYAGKFLREKLVIYFGGFVTVLTILFNGFLTTYIVRYNSNILSGIRIGTMPIEDIGYGFLLLTLVIGLYEYLKK